IGIWAGISGLGLAIGPLLGGFLTQHFSWSAVFWVNVPIGVIALGVTAWAVIESRDPSARSLDIVGTVLISASLFSLTWGLIKTANHAWLGTYTLAFIGAAIGGRMSGRVGPRWLMTVGMLLASIGLFGLSFVRVDSSYNLIWPFQILMGAGMALTMPAVSATGMAAVERTKAGIASGVIN